MSQAGSNSGGGGGGSGIQTIDLDSGSITGATVKLSGGTTGLTTSAVSGTEGDLVGTLVVANGGTGDTSFTAYTVLCGGTTSTGALQNVASVGTSGQVLTSNGAAALPSFQSLPASSPIYTYTSVNAAGSPYTVLNTDQYIGVDCSAGTVLLLFPDAPAVGRYWTIKDSTGNAATNNITISTVIGATPIDGIFNLLLTQNYGSLSIIFNGTGYEIF